MKAIKVNIPTIGACEVRTPMVGDLAEHMGLMSEDTQAFMLKALSVSVYHKNERVDDVLNKIPFDMFADLVTNVSEVLGFKDDEESGND
jgi:hypothetical protein